MINASLDEIVESNNDYWATTIVKIAHFCPEVEREQSNKRPVLPMLRNGLSMLLVVLICFSMVF